MPDLDTAELVELGRVGRAHGIRGEVRFFAHNRDSDAWRRLGAVDRVELRLDGQTLSTRVTRARVTPKCWLLAFEDLPDRTAVEAWTHATLHVPADLFPPLSDDEFYAWQLEGLALVDHTGRRRGHVTEMTDFGAGDLLRVRVDGRDEFIPLAEPFVGEIDIDGGVVHVDLRGLIDDEDPA